MPVDHAALGTALRHLSFARDWARELSDGTHPEMGHNARITAGVLVQALDDMRAALMVALDPDDVDKANTLGARS